ILTLTDNTEERERHLQLEQTNKLATLGEMAAGIAHELNQPLNAIKLTAKNLERQYQHDKAKAEKHMLPKLEQIIAQVDRATIITDHMRKSARLANEEQATADINTVINEAYLLVEPSMRLESIEFRTEIDAALPSCKLHPVRLEQVLLNLITNARDAFRERAEENRFNWILITARQKNKSTIELTFEDSAGGIPEGTMNRIFDPFYTTKEVGKGTGLGLSISHSIITDSGGKLSVRNTEGGAKFTLLLPV
ncbi:MAG: ATP-binding protein, partial [Luminiphilus sp.]|nr:ATP-binding protein [Luminiphilus sp.]